MSRSIQNCINEYDRYTEKHLDPFFLSDLVQLREMSDGLGLYDVIHNALEVGFIVGYRRAKRDMKKESAT